MSSGHLLSPGGPNVITAEAIAGRAAVVIQAIDKTGPALQKIGDNLHDIAAKVTLVGKAMVGLGAAIGIPLASAIKSTASFSDEILALKGVIGASDKQIASLEQKIRDLGASTSFTAQEVAQAATELGRGGLSGEQIQSSLEATLNLARAGRIELAKSGKIIAQTMQLFEGSGLTTDRIADMFVKAANSGTTNVEELAQAFSFSGSTAREMGFELNEALAILSVMSKSMLTSTKAGTSYNQMLLRLVTEHEKLKKVGINAFDEVTGKVKPAMVIMRELAASVKGMTDQQRIGAMAKLFNVRGARIALPLARNIEKILDLNEELVADIGVAGRISREMDSGIGGSIRRILSAFDELKISVGESFVDAFKAGEQFVIPFLNKLSNFVKKNQVGFVKLAKYAVALVTGGAGLMALGGVLTIMGGLAGAVGTLASAFSTLAGIVALPAIATLIPFIPAVIAALPILAAAFAVAASAVKNFFEEIFDGVMSKVTFDTIMNVGVVAIKMLEDAMWAADRAGKALGGTVANIVKFFTAGHFGNLISTIILSKIKDVDKLMTNMRRLEELINVGKLNLTPEDKAGASKKVEGVAPPIPEEEKEEGLTEEEKTDLRNKILADKRRLDRDKYFQQQRLKEASIADKRMREDRAKSFGDLAVLRTKLATAETEAEKIALRNQISEREKAIKEKERLEKASLDRLLIEDRKFWEGVKKREADIAKDEKKLGEKVALPGGSPEELMRAGATTATEASLRGVDPGFVGPTETAALEARAADLRRRILALQKQKNMGFSSSLPGNFQRGSAESIQKIAEIRGRMSQEKYLSSIDKEIKELIEIEAKALEELREAARPVGVG